MNNEFFNPDLMVKVTKIHFDPVKFVPGTAWRISCPSFDGATLTCILRYYRYDSLDFLYYDTDADRYDKITITITDLKLSNDIIIKPYSDDGIVKSSAVEYIVTDKSIVIDEINGYPHSFYIATPKNCNPV